MVGFKPAISAFVIGLIFGLPVLGLLLAGKPLPSPFTLLPIPTTPGAHSFHWGWFITLTVIICITLLPFFIRWFRSQTTPHSRLQTSFSFPWWGWFALGWICCAWTLAWTRFSWFEPFQPHTFPLLWFGYIGLINALTFQRKGHCFLTHSPKIYGSLFLLSAGFWWTFEYLNQFVQNWHYVGFSSINTFEAYVFMTVSFSTVLPAVWGTVEWLSTFPRLTDPFEHWHHINRLKLHRYAWFAVVFGAIGLLCIGLQPTWLFPLLWVSPLLIIMGFQQIREGPNLLQALAQGNWCPVVLPALAALICGVFWEMWNFASLVHWEYTIPFVHAFQVFEMPLLGYSGYLPFGLECVAVVELFLGVSVNTYSSQDAPLSTSPLLKWEWSFSDHG